jgi:hypothetical protein
MKVTFSMSLGCQDTFDFQVVTSQIKKCRDYTRLLCFVHSHYTDFIFVCGVGVNVYAKRIKLYQ